MKGSKTKQLNVALPEELHARFKARMAMKGRTMQEQVLEWISDAVKASSK